MRNKKAQGFTLIELLIVIAIIGILAAVLIPNLLSARTTAQVRANQAYLQNVYTAANAYLAEDPLATGADVTQACGDGNVYDAGGAGKYTVPDPGAITTSCTVADNGDGTITVSGDDVAGTTVSIP